MTRHWILYLVLGLFLWAGPVMANPVRVTSGEHDGFTRLVFDYGRVIDWQVGRSADGYQLRVTDPPPAYNLTNAFNLIGKSRLAAIWANPENGQLHIGLACACHVIPFEFRPGIVVLDIKDGPPPSGSSFETALDGSLRPPLDAPILPRPRPRPTALPNPEQVPAYDWVKTAHSALREARPQGLQASTDREASSILPLDPNLQPLRDQILHQITRGAAQGVVEMDLPPSNEPQRPPQDFQSAHVRIGEAQTSVTRKDRATSGDLGATGETCIDKAWLSIQDWGDERASFSDQLATLRQNLSAEFDEPNPEAFEKSIKFNIFLGFGAEARQMIDAFDTAHSQAKIWSALSHLIEIEPDPDGVFIGQAACGGPAALWAVLGDPALSPGDPIDEGAIRLAFSALPLHLRRHIGPTLSERLIQLGHPETARALGDAITRAPGDAGHAVALMDAALDLHKGDPIRAENVARAVLADAGPNQPEALVTLTNARAAQNLPIPTDVAVALRAHLSDHQGSPLEPRLQKALILAEAASGNFEGAFADLPGHPDQEPAVWAMVASMAPDDVFLTFAVRDKDAKPPTITDETAAMLARRLVGLGMAKAADPWLELVDQPDPLLLAEAAIKRRDGRAALPSLAGQTGDLVDALKLQALSLLGDDRLQVEILTRAGDLQSASAAMARAGDWEDLAQAGQDPWKSMAAQIKALERISPEQDPASTPADGGPLAQGHALAKAGADTRDSVERLLASLPQPSMSAQSQSNPEGQ